MSLLFPVLPAVVVLLAIGGYAIVSYLRKKSGADGAGKGMIGKDRDSTVREATRRLTQNGRDRDALLALGDVYFREERFDLAMKTYQKLVELCAMDSKIDEYFATLRYSLSAIKCNHLEEGYKGLLFAKSLKENEFDVNYNLGYLEYQNKNYERAIQLLSLAEVSQPEDPTVLRFLGHSLFKVRRWAEAAAVLRKAVDRAPEDKESLYAVARCYHELGQDEQAIKIFVHLRADPQLGPNAALFAGTIHLRTRQYDEAVKDFMIGLKHPTATPDVVLELKYRLAATYIKQEAISDAIALLQEIVEASPGYKDVDDQLRRYGELHANENLKIYLISPTAEFVALCRKLIVSFFPQAKVKFIDISVQKSEYTDILASVATIKWEDLVLFRFVRTSGTVGELILRDLQSRIKEAKAGRGYCFAAGSYSEGAKQFVEARLIDLVEKEQLMSHLGPLDSRTQTEQRLAGAAGRQASGRSGESGSDSEG